MGIGTPIAIAGYIALPIASAMYTTKMMPDGGWPVAFVMIISLWIAIDGITRIVRHG